MSRNQDAKTRRQTKNAVRPGLEQLESRLVPAKVVTTILDTTNPSSPTIGSLRAAVSSNVPSDQTVEFNDYLFAASIGVTHNPTALAVGNFRGGGKVDVVTASRFTNSLSFSPDNGNGLGVLSQASTTFNSTFATGGTITALEAVDLNGDLNTDLIMVQSDGKVYAAIGSGTGTFAGPTAVGTLGGAAAGLAVGDFNKDGKTDFAVALTGATGKVVYAMGNGNGTFAAAQTVTLSGTGSGNLVSMAVGDVTGDGTDDVVSLSSAGVLTALPGVASGSALGTPVATTVAGSPFTYLGLGDLNNDGRADALLVNSASGIISVAPASASTPGAFLSGTSITLPAGAAPGLLRVADLNADGKADFAVTQYGLDNVAVYTGKGDGSFNLTPSTFDVVDPTDIRVRDMNGDGLPDLVCPSETSQSFAVFTNSGNASFSPVASKQATFILNGAVGAISDTLNNNLKITGGSLFGPGAFDASGNSLANLPRVVIQADVGFNQADYDLTNTTKFPAATTNRGSGFTIGDVIQQGITNTQGGARFQVLGVDAAGGITTLRVLQPGSQTVYDPFSASNTKIDSRLALASTTLSQSNPSPYFKLTAVSGTGTGLAFPTANLTTTQRASGLFFQNTPATRNLTLDGLSLRAAHDNSIIVTQGSFSITNSTMDDVDATFGTNRDNRHFISLQTGAGSLTVTNSRFENSQVDAINGGSSGTITITGSSFSNNDGQGLRVSAGTVTITGSTFTYNGDLESTISREIYLNGYTLSSIPAAVPPLGIGGFGGGRGMNAAGTVNAGTITVTGSVFDNNRHATIPSVDRSLYLGANTISVSNSIFRNNTNNGALELSGTNATVTTSQFDNNASPLTFNREWPTPAATQGDRLRGGAAILIRDNTALTLSLSKFTNNTVDNIDSRFSGGGAIYLSSGTANISECAFEGNSAIITDYPNSGSPGFYNPETSPTARYSGGGALYAGGQTIIRDSYFTKNSVTSYVDIWNPSYDDNASATRPQYSGGGAVLLTRNLDSTITSDVFNTTFVGNFVQQVEANKDINGAGKQRLDSGIGYIPLDASFAAGSMQSVGIDDAGTNRGQITDGSDSVTSTRLTTDATNNTTRVTSSAAIGGSIATGNTGVSVTNLALTDNQAALIPGQDIPTAAAAGQTATYQLSGKYVSASTLMTAPTAPANTTVTFAGLSTPWFQSGTPMTGSIYSTTYVTGASVTSPSTANNYTFTIPWTTSGGQMTGTLLVNGVPQQTFVYTRNAATLTATDVGTPTNRIQTFSFVGTTLSLSLNAAPAATDTVAISNLSYPTTGRTLIQTFTFDGTTLTFTPIDVGTPTTKAINATYNTSTSALSLILNSAAPAGMQFSADILYPQGLISRIVHTSVSGAIYVGGTKVQNINSVTADGTVMLGSPGANTTFALSGRLDLNTGVMSLVWNTATPAAGTLTITSATGAAVTSSVDNGIRVDYRQSGIIDISATDSDNDSDTDFSYIDTTGNLQIRRNVRIEPASTNPFAYAAAVGGTNIAISGTPVSIAMGKFRDAGGVAVLRKTSTDNTGFTISTYLWDTSATTPTWGSGNLKRDLTVNLPSLPVAAPTPWTKIIGADVDGNGLTDIVAFNPGAGVARVYSTIGPDANGIYYYYQNAYNIDLKAKATAAVAAIFAADPNPYTSFSITDIGVTQLDASGNLDIAASVKLVSSDPSRPTDAVLMASGTADNLYFVKNNRLDVLDETMNIRSNQIFDFRLDEQSTNSGIDNTGKYAAAGSYLADPSRLSAFGVLQPITFAPRADLLGKPLAGIIYADNNAIQRFFYDNAAGTFQFEKIGLPDEFVTSAALSGTGALTLNWNSDYGATHVALRDAAFTNTVTENAAITVSTVDPATDTLTLAATAPTTGTVVTLAGTGTATGLFVGNRYFVINTGTGTVKLAASLLDATTGKAVDITAIGTPAFSLIPEDNSVTFSPVGASFRSNTTNAYVPGSFSGFVYVNGTVVQGYTVGAGGVLSFNQVNPSRYLAVATGSSYDVLTGILTLAWNRDISTVPVRASITNTLGTSVTDFAAIPTTTLYDNAQTFVTNGSVKGTIYAGNTAVQTFSTGNTTTEPTNTVAVVATDTSTTFAALAHPVSIYADNYISDITTTLTGTQFARGSILVSGQAVQSFTLDRASLAGNVCTINLGGITTPVASGTFNIATRVLTINWAAGQTPAANVSVSLTYTTPDLVFNFTKVGNPSIFVTSATLDPITHAFSLVWNGNPDQSRIDYSFSPAESFTTSVTANPAAGQFTITSDPVLGPGRYTTFRVLKNSVSTGSLNGTIYLGTSPIQTFEFSETGTLRLAEVGNPSLKVTNGLIDHATGTFTLFWNGDVSAASPNTIVAYRQAYGVGPVAVSGQNFLTANANLSNSTYYGSGAGFGVASGATNKLTAGSLPNMPSTGRGLNGGAILVSEGRQVTGLVTANEAARAGGLNVRVYNTTVVANSLINTWAMNTSNAFPNSTVLFDPTRGSRQNRAPGSNYYAYADRSTGTTYGLMGDSGGIFNDTNGGSVRLLNSAVVSNTGLAYYTVSVADALTFSGVARITQQDLAQRPTAYGPGAFSSQGSTLYRPTASPDFNNGPTKGDLIQTDQQINFDNFTLIDTDNFRPTLLGPSISNAGSSQYQYSDTQQQKIKYLPLSRLSPGRDAGTALPGGLPYSFFTTSDIRGANRTVNNAIDIGAFEVQVASATTLLTATTPGQNGGNPVVVTPFEYGQPINLNFKSAWNDNVPPTAALTGNISVLRATDDKVLGVSAYGVPVNASDISTGKSAVVTFNPASAQYPTLLDIGTNVVYGVFSGDFNYATSQTNPFNIVINKASTAVTLNPLTPVNSGSAVTITGFVTTPLSQASLTNEGSLLLEYKAPGAGGYTTVPTPALTLVSSSPNKYSFTYTVPAGTFNALGSWDIHAKFVAGGLNHYSNSDGDTFISTTQDVVDQAKLALQILDGSKNVISSPATVAHFTSFYIRAILADGVDVTKRTGGIDLLDSKSNIVFTFPAAAGGTVITTGNSTGLASQGIPDGTAVTYFDYLFSNNSASTSLALQADDKLSARYNGYPTPSTNFYLGATTATQTLDLPGIKAALDLSTALSFTTDPVSGAKTYQTTYGAPYTVTANLGNNGNPTANFNGGSVSLVQVLPAPNTTIGTATVPTAPAANSFSGSFANLTPRGAGLQQYDATYTGDGFNYDPLTTTNPIGILNVNVAKANVASTSLASPIYAAQGSKVTFTVNLSNTLGALPAGFSLPTGTVKFFANPSGGTPVLLGQTPNSDPTSGVYTFTYTTTAGGSYPITIDYSGDGNYNTLTSQPFGTLIVPTISLNIGGNPANVARGATVNFTATVAPAGTSAERTGDVTFTFANGSTVKTVIVPNSAAVAGVYTLSTQLGGSTLDLANGTYTVTASYAQGSGLYPNMTSASRVLNVGLSSSTTTLSPTTVSGQYRYGEDIALAATVTGAVGLPFVAPGSVSIFDGVTNLTPSGLAIVAANASAPATATQTVNSSTLASALAVGSHTFQAKYSGDGANYIASNSAIQSVTVLQADTTSAVSAISPAAGIVASGSPLTLQVTVSTPAYVAANAARPTGTVTFVSGAATLGTATVSNGVASLTINPTALGNFNFTATYSGDGNYTSSQTGSTFTVAALNFAPVAVGAQTRNIIQRGEQLTLSASVAPAVGSGSASPLGVVQFIIPGSTDTIVASVPYSPTSGGVYSTTIDTGNPAFNLPVGTYNLVAKYVPASGDAYPILTSASQTLTVGRQSVTLAGTLGSTTIVYGSTVVLASASIGTGLIPSSIPFAAGQTVDMYDGQTLVAQIPFSDNFRVLNLPTTKLEAGLHNLQLRYAGDANYRPATLDLPPLTVTQAATNLSLSTSATSLKAGQAFTFTAQVTSPQLGLPSSPTGTVLFSVALAGAPVAVGQVTLNQISQASFNFTPSAAGAFVVTATYSGDRNFSDLNSSASKTVVASALTQGAISPNVVSLGAKIRLTALMAPGGDGLFSQNGTVDFILPNGALVARATAADSQLTANGRLYTKDVDTGVAGNNLRAGTTSVRAVYVPGIGDTYPGITTDPQPLVINRQITDTILTANPLTGSTFGTPVSFTMTTTPRVAAGSADTTIPFADGGSLSLFDGSVLLQRLPVSGTSATATFSVPALSAGLHNFTAVYSGDSVNFNPSTSATLTMSIAKAATTLSLTPSTGAGIQVGTATKFTASLATTVTAGTPTGSVQFTMGGVSIGSPVALVNGSASITYTATKSGQGALAATYLGDGNFASSTASANIQFRARQPFFVVASQAGSTFMTYDSKTGRQISIFQPLGPSYVGGFRVATGDVSGDGVADLAYTTSTGSFVRLMDGRTGASLGGFYAYTTNYTKPVNIAIADINGDGRGDIIAAPGGTGVAATVKVFSGLNYGLLFSRNVFNAGFTGGVSVAGGDVDGDGKADIICTPFSGGGPRVQVYSGANGTLLRDQTLFATTSTSGYSVAADDLNGDGKADFILAGMSGAQQVVVSDGATGALLGSFLPFAPTFTGGARVATVDDIDGDGIRDIIVASGPNGQSQVKRYSGRNLAAIDGFFAYAAANAARNKGLFIG